MNSVYLIRCLWLFHFINFIFLFRRYNPETHDVVGMCKRLEEVFEARFRECPTGDEVIESQPPTPGLLVHHPPPQVSYLKANVLS